MLIVFKPYGDHSNRLFQNISYESLCLEYNIKYVNISFADMSILYNKPCITLPPVYNSLISSKTESLIRKLLPGKIISCNSQEDKQKNISYIIKNSKKILFAEDWHININSLVKKYQDIFIYKYSLKKKYWINNPLYLKLKQLKKERKLIVGVHIRRGDFKTFCDGIYYYSDDVYLKFMNDISSIIKNCYFFIFTNGEISFTNNSNITISKENWYIDHFLMSNCDYLIGAPSTFTMWASYIGKVKYFHIYDTDKNITLDDFVLYTEL